MHTPYADTTRATSGPAPTPHTANYVTRNRGEWAPRQTPGVSSHTSSAHGTFLDDLKSDVTHLHVCILRELDELAKAASAVTCCSAMSMPLVLITARDRVASVISCAIFAVDSSALTPWMAAASCLGELSARGIEGPGWLRGRLVGSLGLAGAGDGFRRVVRWDLAVDGDRAHGACVAEACCAVLVELVDQEVG